ncbi:MAG: alpha/beta fold hydrolase [Thermoleophilaceae bacterium]|nr:alpha/beta fold hydrolase [Thermoleophilaceae bacterium]
MAPATSAPDTGDFEVLRQLPGAGSATLSGEDEGDGTPLVLLHGLTATRRNVVQGSRGLVRQGYRQISYDARGHGRSSPAPSYAYPDLIGDLGAVLADRGLERAVLAGSSMGAATAMGFALRHPERVPALVQITPAFAGASADESRWDRLADALESGGIEAFVNANDPDTLPERWRESVRMAITQRMERHEHLDAVAAALRAVPRSLPWEGLEPLERLEVPTLVIGSRDEADPLHPLAVAEAYARLLPDVELVVEEEGQPPLAWQGGRLARTIVQFLESRLSRG